MGCGTSKGSSADSAPLSAPRSPAIAPLQHPVPAHVSPLSLLDHSEIKKLVCESCWRDFFSTDEFWELCKTDPDVDPVRSATHQDFDIENASLSDACNWCAFVTKTCPYPPGSWTIDVKLQQDKHNLVDVPAGTNQWLIDTDQGAFMAFSFTDADDNCAPYVTARPVQSNVGTQAAFEEVAVWLEACKYHTECPPRHELVLPTRVIEISPQQNPAQPRILSTKGATGNYTALSYCWGGPQLGCLTESKMAQYLTALNLDELSQTIRDAIEVTRKVGVEYLWVDALCIIQDSDLDKAREISMMDQIYNNASFTIAAGSGSAASQGFLGSRDPQPLAYRIPFRCPDGSFGSMFLRDAAMEPSENSYLDERAWTLQEEFLSPRILAYDRRTVKWSCSAGSSYLGAAYGKRSLPMSLTQWTSSGAATDPDEATYQWMLRLIGNYSSRKHSVPADRLAALSGIAKALAPEFGCDYLAGVWLQDLPAQLLWNSKCKPENTRPAVYRAPSWSWASIDGPVWGLHKSYLETACTIVQCKTEPKYSEAPFSEVVSGYLVVEGQLRSGRYSVVDEQRPYTACISWDNDTTHVVDKPSAALEATMVEGLWELHLDTPHESLHGRAVFLVIMAYEDPERRAVQGLMLRRLENRIYQRLGTFRTRHNYDSDMGDPPICRITIV